MKKMKLVGYKRNDFTTKDGAEVHGYNVFFECPLTENGVGVEAEATYLSEKKLADNEIDLKNAIGKQCLLAYNRYHKVDSIHVLG